MDLKDTLNLPKTQFPMRGNLVKREPERIAHWKEIGLYEKIQEKNADKPAFILHDGPPFTNGDVHIGTALNKILKDSILRYKTMRGFRTPYVPGWDCHGLPIEFKVTKDLQQKKIDLPASELRKACADFSASFIETQRGQFDRLGILANWEEEYKTMNPAYEAEILRTFSAFVEKGLVYRSKKPVYWSIPCATALAEAEIEYEDHTSPSIWVKFDIPEHPFDKAAGDLSIVIWTTTPWTLPANMAVAVHPRLDYVEVLHEGKRYLVAEALADTFIADCELEGATLGDKHKGESLEKLEARHPFIDRASPVVLADYVTTESGTGCVHTAPGHGLDDYLTGLNYNLDIYCPLDDNGCYIDDGQMPEVLVGTTVLEKKGKCPANKAVLTLLTEKGALLRVKKCQHQYPHCWRSKTPVIFRAMDQWFVSLDKEDMRKEVLENIGKVDWIPGWGENRIRGAVESRPDWCISRQRSWGVPIPVFFDEDKNALLDADVIKQLADKIETEGTNLWFEKTPEELLEGIPLPEAFVGKTLVKGSDTLDVWIDSGCSHRAVLKKNPSLSWPADLYLEGSDQHRGWFQSSIWTGVIADGQAPYKKVITHGFIVNENGRKISKSDGAMSSNDWVKQYGADIMRLWVSSQDFTNEIRLSKDHFKLISNTYRTIRNTLIYQLGNLADFDFEKDAIPAGELNLVDQWALAKTSELIDNVAEAYDAYEFHKAYQLFGNFFRSVLSNTYHDILKDRLYTYGPDWKDRRSSQTAIKLIFDALIKVVAPILTFTADEAFAFAQKDSVLCESSVHLEDWPSIDSAYFDQSVVDEVEQILLFRDKTNEKLESLRQAKTIGSSLDAKLELNGRQDDPIIMLLQKHIDKLPELFIVSQVILTPSEDADIQIHASHADGKRCPRCWRWETADFVGETEKICPRCSEALQS